MHRGVHAGTVRVDRGRGHGDVHVSTVGARSNLAVAQIEEGRIDEATAQLRLAQQAAKDGTEQQNVNRLREIVKRATASQQATGQSQRARLAARED